MEEKEMRKIRGNSISMIFQEPMTSLNPVYDLSFQISEVIMLHQNKNKKEARKIAIEMLDLVGIPEPQKRIDSFPHELSGGMRQRAMIAMALSCNPKILIADEPTTALDVTIQAQIIELMQELQKKLGMSIIFITHDLGVVSEISDHVMVMYLGNVMEIAETKELFNNPLHSYTKSLIDIAPQITEEKRKIRLLKGEIPSPINPPSGCVFRTRCPNPSHECKHGTSEMGLIEPKPGHFVDQCCYNCN
jgi:oligopeptide/dipeptide ABC transporter ATP-binding protein